MLSSTESLERRISEVLREHQLGYEKPTGFLCISIECDWYGDDAQFPDHVAEVVVAELRLTEETNAHDADRYTTDDIPATHHRFISPWIVIDKSTPK